jgi:glycosyltransferase involved in cell wall biosynthesis
MWPEVFVEILPRPFHIFGRLILEPLFDQTRVVLKNANGLLGITDEFLGLALNKIKRTKSKNDGVFELGYLENQFTDPEFQQATDFWVTKGLKRDNHIKICFFGTLGHQFELETIVKAAQELEKNNVQIILCGTGDNLDRLKNMAVNCANVFFPGYMSAAQIATLMSISDFGLCPYKSKEAFLNSIPGKAIEYLSAGLPIISSLGAGVLGRYIQRHNIGINYDGHSAESFVSSVNAVMNSNLRHDRARIKMLFNDNFKAETIYAKYLKHLENVVSG